MWCGLSFRTRPSVEFLSCAWLLTLELRRGAPLNVKLLLPPRQSRGVSRLRLESWEIPDAKVADVYSVLAHGELLPRWWKGVYLEAHKLSDNDEPRVGDRLRVRARGFLPYELNFIVETVELDPGKRVAVKTVGDFEGLWTAHSRSGGPAFTWTSFGR
jgi:hypothetical protein